MHLKHLSFLLTIVSSVAAVDFDIRVDSFTEMAIYTLTNAARVNPSFYLENIAKDSKALRGCMATAPAMRPLGYNRRLSNAAQEHSTDMAAFDCFSHNNCDSCNEFGCDFSSRIKKAGYGQAELAENIVMSPGGALKLMDLWLGSAGHCKNIFDSTLKDLGVGCQVEGIQSFCTQDFGGQFGTSVGQLVGGIHVQNMFLAVVHGGSQGQINAVINNQRIPMRHMGNGLYFVEKPKRVGACTPYFFEEVKNGQQSQVFPPTQQNQFNLNCRQFVRPGPKQPFVAPKPVAPKVAPKPAVKPAVKPIVPTQPAKQAPLAAKPCNKTAPKPVNNSTQVSTTSLESEGEGARDVEILPDPSEGYTTGAIAIGSVVGAGLLLAGLVIARQKYVAKKESGSNGVWREEPEEARPPRVQELSQEPNSPRSPAPLLG